MVILKPHNPLWGGSGRLVDRNTKAARSLFSGFINLLLLLVLLSCDDSNPSTQTAAHRAAEKGDFSILAKLFSGSLKAEPRVTPSGDRLCCFNKGVICCLPVVEITSSDVSEDIWNWFTGDHFFHHFQSETWEVLEFVRFLTFLLTHKSLLAEILTNTDKCWSLELDQQHHGDPVLLLILFSTETGGGSGAS